MTDALTPRERVLSAAFEEFADHGVAGARVDRIAKAAKTSKERVYAYFRSKEELYAAVVDEQRSVVLASVTLDFNDVPAYVSQLFDYFVEHPNHLRLLNWGRLELRGAPTARRDDVLAEKIQRIADAQSDGLIPDDIPALDILVLLTQLATAWLASTEFHGLADPQDQTVLAERRAAVVLIAQRLLAPR